MAVMSFTGRPPADAVAFLKDKLVGGRLSHDWRDVWQDEHVTSFVVAKMASRDLLADVHRSLIDALSNGVTREQFVRDLRPMLEKAGWWGRQVQTDPVTGVAREVQLGSPRRLRTIFDVNMRMATAAGRWQRIEETKAALPFLVYTAVLDGVTRPQHAAWGGRGAVRIVLPVDHPFWRTHYPPNGWHCRCTVLQMSQAMLDNRGWTVTSEDALAKTDWKKTRPWLNSRNGRTEVVPVGIDPGFAYNVGQARRAALAPPPVDEPQRDMVVGERFPRALPATPKPRPYPPGVAKRPDLEGEAVFDAFARALGTPEGGVFFDRAQIPLTIERGLFQQRDAQGVVKAAKGDKRGRAAYAEVFGATLRDPDEIWMSAQQRLDGSIGLVRTYVAAFVDPDGERYWMTVVFGDRDGWWYGVSAFPADKPGKPESQARYVAKNGRVGTLVYRRGR
ncbi:PBECR2 nuclease fold domain-containing protein [uncultured Brevundimonas sp.]|uniref:PBECR2 nuclease fold domain-containing protein n=1 Tax=uncultured Brevundimonas sp. TaxID=213418 RepID=UPI002619FC57|nr:PBECR2 nuclease fold domain-containing protein [uncultured Brevundimonas sp.]